MSKSTVSEKKLAAEFDQAFERLRSLVDLEEANQMFQQPPQTVFTASVVLWMLVYQRLKPDASLENAVKHLTETLPLHLPNNKRLTEKKLSSNSGAYSAARKRLPLEVVRWFCDELTQGLVATTEPSFNGKRIFLMDGTTIKLAPEKELQVAFPPASNQHGEGVWPIALLTVFHELQTGCAFLPEVGPMYGDHAISETALARRGMEKLPLDSVVMADAGFGIFGVAHAAQQCGHDFLFRMKKANFLSLCKKATLRSESQHHKSYECTWVPSKKNRDTCPDLPINAALKVCLHEVHVTAKLTLYLVTSLSDDAWTLSNLFERRYDVEVDIRNFKVVLNAENIRAKSVDTFTKELYTSVVAYNLTSQLRREAAKQRGKHPREMSFKRTWTTFQTFLLRHMHSEASQWREAFSRALGYAMKDALPKRSGRQFKREAYRKRPKCREFDKREKPPSKITQRDLN